MKQLRSQTLSGRDVEKEEDMKRKRIQELFSSLKID
jgi:hypothetical protein